MKKIVFLTFLAGFLFLQGALAQSRYQGPKLGIGVDLSLYLSPYKESSHALGVGGSLLYQHPLTGGLNLTVLAGYISFRKENVFLNIKSYERYIPLKAGLRYFLVNGFYAFGEAGAAISTANGGGKGTAFAFSAGIGSEFALGSEHSLDLGIRYERWLRSNSGTSYPGLRLGFNF